MRGLLLKDFYIAVKYCRAVFLIVIIFAICAVKGDSLYFLVYPVLLASIIPVNTISYDEKSRWSEYAGVFPYTRKQLVSAKYIAVLVYLGIAILIEAAAYAVSMLLAGGMDWGAFWQMVSILPVFGLLSPCILLPAVFKLGMEKGRFIYYTVMLTLCIAMAILSTREVGIHLQYYLSMLGTWCIPAAGILILVFLVLSWLLSIYFYQNKDL